MDHTESDKRRMLAVIDLFREQDTVDEFGMSAVWDAFADLLFPGTGTVQTGAPVLPLRPVDVPSR